MSDEQMTTWVVRAPALTIDAETPEEAIVIAREMWSRGSDEECTSPYEDVLEALAFYADPEAYWAIFIVPDRPSGLFADDVGCCLMDGEHDHRHGRAARKALGDEWGGAEPCAEMLEQMANLTD